MTGKKLVDTILVALTLLTTLGVLGLFYFTEKMYKKPPIDEVKEKEALMKQTDEKATPELFKLETMVFSLIPKDSQKVQRMRYLEIEVHLVLFEAEDKEMLKNNLPVVQDRIMEISSKMGPEELSTLSGKILLENRIKTEINQKLNKPVVKTIYFSRYIVQ